MNKLFLFVVALITLNAAAQSSASAIHNGAGDGVKWTSANPFSQKVFIENKGQCRADKKTVNASDVLFTAEIGHQIYFTKSGYVCRMSKLEDMKEGDQEKFFKSGEADEHKKKEEEENERPMKIVKEFYVNMEWVGANPAVEIVVEEKVNEYWNFLDPKDSTKSINRVAGFKKLTYKNIYPAIDVVYTFHPSEGLKYNLILHPGADVSVIKMKYADTKKLYVDKSGNICFTTPAGKMTDNAPETFYGENHSSIKSSFTLKNNVVTFNLEAYDNTKEVIIDPWMNSSLTPQCTVVEIAADGANNVYIYGFTGQIATGNPVMQYVQKYSPAGALIWTFNLTQGMNFIQNIGDLSVDPAGNAYVSCGFYMIGYFFADCAHAKLDPAGVLVWNKASSPLLYENWRNAFNCDFTQLIMLGCGPGCCNVGSGDIVNPITGIESGKFSPPAVGDILTASYGKNGNLYFISVKDTSPNNASPHLTCLNPSTGFSVVFSIPFPSGATFIDGFNTNYGTYGFNGIVAGCSFLYVCMGSTLQKRDLTTGALLGSVAVPGGVQFSNSGTAVDKCGNIYVGSSTGVHVFSSSLSLLSSFATSGPVLDIVVGTGGTFYACGGTASSTSNTGFVAQFSLTTVCNPITITSTPNACGSSNIGTATANAVFCAAPYTYAWSTSPVQTTQTATGLAGGTYTVVVTGAGACNEKDTAVVVIPSSSLLVTTPAVTNILCNGANTGSANATVTGGTAPFTYSWTPTSQTTATASNLPAGTYSVLITDATGCAGTQTVSITQPTALSATVSSTSATCGNANASATVTATGGTGAYTYNWNPSAQTTATASNISPGNYSVTITDVNSCVTTKTITVASTGNITATAGPNSNICIGQTATLTVSGATTYTWSNGQNTSSVSVSPNVNTTYSVVAASGNCTDTVFVNVNVNQLPIVGIGNSGAASICAGQSTTLTANGANTYNWSPSTGLSSVSGTSVVANPNTPITYTVVGTDANGCTNSAATLVLVTPGPQVSVGPSTISGCVPLCVNFSNTTSSSGNCSWTFSDGASSNSCTPIHCFYAQGTFTALLTLTDGNGCVGTSSATVVVFPKPHADFTASPQPTTILDPLIHFTNASSGANITSYNWSFGENNSHSNTQNPTHEYANVGNYPVMLTVISDHGCMDSIIKIIVIGEDEEIFVPNAFTPNGDGNNDIFMPKGTGIHDYKLYIFDRWGNQVFHSDNINFGWDGRYKNKGDEIVQEDVYVWKIDYSNSTGKQKELSGVVSLIK